MKNIFISITLLTVVGVTGFLTLRSTYNEPVSSAPLPEKVFRCETVIKIITPRTKASTLSSREERADSFSNWIINRLEDNETFAMAVDDYQLGKLFGCDPEKLKGEMANNITIKLDSCSRLVTVITHGASKMLAQKLNYALLKSVEEIYHEQSESNQKQAVTLLKVEAHKQKARVEDHRKKLYSLSKQLGIPQTTEQKNALYENAKRKRDQLENLLSSVTGLDGEDLIITILASGVSELAVLKFYYEEESKMKQQRAASLASGHRLSERVTNELDERMAKIQHGLKKSVDDVLKRLKKDLAVLNQKLTDLKSSQLEEETKQLVSDKDKNRIFLARENYERALHVYDAIKDLDFSSQIEPLPRRQILRFIKTGWSKDIPELLENSRSL